jgi:hypothetical protein
LAKDKLTEIISRGQTKVEPQTTHSEDFGGHPAPSANELMNQNVAATAAIDGNTIVSGVGNNERKFPRLLPWFFNRNIA